MKCVSIEYLAGLVDGEGCLDFSSYKYKDKRYKYPMLRIGLVEKDSKVLKLINKQYGGSLNFRKFRPDRPNNQPMVLWVVCGKNCFYLITKLIPYLIVKRDKAKYIVKNSKKYD